MSIPQEIARSEIEALIPHAGAMVLLERIVSTDQAGICCETETHRDPENPLREAAGLPASAGIEYAAQAAALHAALSSADGAPKQGVLAVVSNVVWHIDWLNEAAAPLWVRATLQDELAGGRRYAFSLSAGGAEIIAGEMLLAI